MAAEVIDSVYACQHGAEEAAQNPLAHVTTSLSGQNLDLCSHFCYSHGRGIKITGMQAGDVAKLSVHPALAPCRGPESRSQLAHRHSHLPTNPAAGGLTPSPVGS